MKKEMELRHNGAYANGHKSSSVKVYDPYDVDDYDE